MMQETHPYPLGRPNHTTRNYLYFIINSIICQGFHKAFLFAKIVGMEYAKQWEFLVKKFKENQLAHAYVLAGSEGEMLLDFAQKFIEHIIQKVTFGTTLPVDVLVVSSLQSESSQKNEKDMMEIDIDQIRQLNTFLSYTAYYGGYKAVIIKDAERMNQEAQSSLLKTLEEPRGKTLVFLISSQPDQLMSTIFSRCQVIKFRAPAQKAFSRQEEALLENFLAIASSDLAEKFQYAKKMNFEEQSLISLLEIIQRHFRNLLLGKLGILPSDKEQKTQLTLEKIQKILVLIDRLRYQAMVSNASPKLALEVLLLAL